jgi:prepilin-type N-terminal cleavage/methylation domain-containing protein
VSGRERSCGQRIRQAGPASGFTLIELVVVIAVLGILAAAVSPAIVQQLVDSRIQATQEETRALYTGMVGTPDGNSFGFVGDMGRLPASFTELAQRGGLAVYTTNTVRSIGVGWRGPYVNMGTSATDYLVDAWGHAYTGAATGQARSAGPDGVANTPDDIVYPPAPPVIGGTVTVTVKTTMNGKTVVDPPGYRVDLYYASNGVQNALSDTAGPFSFTNVPLGVHALRVVKTANPGAGTKVAEDTIVVRPNGTAAAELWF